MPTLKDLLAISLLPANDNTAAPDDGVRLPPEPPVRTRDATDFHRPGAGDRPPAARPRGGQRGAIQHRALRPRRRT